MLNNVLYRTGFTQESFPAYEHHRGGNPSGLNTEYNVKNKIAQSPLTSDTSIWGTSSITWQQDHTNTNLGTAEMGGWGGGGLLETNKIRYRVQQQLLAKGMKTWAMRGVSFPNKAPPTVVQHVMNLINLNLVTQYPQQANMCGRYHTKHKKARNVMLSNKTRPGGDNQFLWNSIEQEKL